MRWSEPYKVWGVPPERIDGEPMNAVIVNERRD